MTNSVSLLGLFAPPPGARDAKVSEDNVLASFAGVLAGVNQANAKLLVPTPQVEGTPTDGEVLENTEDGEATADSKTTDDTAEPVAAAAAPSADAAPTTAVVAANSNAINHSVAALNPALQEKLARVISRMRDETGHSVQVTETYRSQSRQDALYSQGRQTDGPIVTWTQNSKHTQGRAVDVTLDGGRASADAYTALERIANEEGLRTLGAKDPGHLELPAKSPATVQASNDVLSIPGEPAAASGRGQVSIARLAQIAPVATVARVANVAKVGATHAPVGHKADASPKVSHLQSQDQSIFAQADGAADMPVISHEIDAVIAPKTVVGGDITIADATGASADNESPVSRADYKPFEISNLDRLSDAVNATRIEDGSQAETDIPADSVKQRISSSVAAFGKTRMAPRAQTINGAYAMAAPQPRGTQPTSKAQGGASSQVQFSAPMLSRSSNDSQSFSSDRQSSNSDATGYSPMTPRGQTTSNFAIVDISTDMTSTASQRAERIMAAQDAPARPLSQIVMSVDAGNGATDRIQVALRGSTINATIDAADHHSANAMRWHSDDLVRSLTRDGMEVDSVRVRTTTASTTSAPVTTVDSSQKSSDSSSDSRFNREVQWDQQRSQQRSNHERRHQQRDQRGGKES